MVTKIQTELLMTIIYFINTKYTGSFISLIISDRRLDDIAVANFIGPGHLADNHFTDTTSPTDCFTDRGQGRSQSQCTDADPLDLLLSSSDSQGQSFTNKEIKDQTLTFIFVDYEITSNLMIWIMYELMTNLSVYQA
ncbi:unnamed protein product [Adineta steineri]|uniref:Uncharacterized protein n=2 Tax=Adineta steineri TaxID=433720 RepID=A0A815BKY9_9BILA|nr:unnamed protein product [Adineta steineri]CAF1556404.1 unnamed protein product [Adineta steineri]